MLRGSRPSFVVAPGLNLREAPALRAMFEKGAVSAPLWQMVLAILWPTFLCAARDYDLIVHAEYLGIFHDDRIRSPSFPVLLISSFFIREQAVGTLPRFPRIWTWNFYATNATNATQEAPRLFRVTLAMRHEARLTVSFMLIVDNV